MRALGGAEALTLPLPPPGLLVGPTLRVAIFEPVAALLSTVEGEAEPDPPPVPLPHPLLLTDRQSDPLADPEAVAPPAVALPPNGVLVAGAAVSVASPLPAAEPVPLAQGAPVALLHGEAALLCEALPVALALCPSEALRTPLAVSAAGV